MNHEFISALIELYEKLPDQSPDGAAHRVAVLVEMELNELEKQGLPITREVLLQKFREAIAQHLKNAA